MPVKFAQLVENFELMSMTSGDSHAYLCRQSGKFYCRMDPLYVGEEYAGELPEDIDDEEKYVALPDKHELDLGKPLVMDFVREVLPQDLDDVRNIFRKKGAYAKFKGLLARRGALEQWYDFERKATERALCEWCELNSIELVD
jgi:uncharacterized protein UPF0158